MLPGYPKIPEIFLDNLGCLRKLDKSDSRNTIVGRYAPSRIRVLVRLWRIGRKWAFFYGTQTISSGAEGSFVSNLKLLEDKNEYYAELLTQKSDIGFAC
jgi:hypothetical protein